MTLHGKCCCGCEHHEGSYEQYYNTGCGGGCHESGGLIYGCHESDVSSNCADGFSFEMDFSVVRYFGSQVGLGVESCDSPDDCAEATGDDDFVGCCCFDCDCSQYYEAQLYTLEINDWTWSSDCGFICVVSQVVELPEDLSGCCLVPNGTEFTEETGGNACDGVYLDAVENGVIVPNGVSCDSYSNVNVDVSTITLDFKFRFSMGTDGYSAMLISVTGPVGFDFDESYNPTGLVYNLYGTPDWPVPNSNVVYSLWRHIDTIAGSGHRCWCNTSTNIHGESITWHDTGSSGFDLVNGTTYPVPPLYSTDYIKCDWWADLPDIDGEPGIDACAQAGFNQRMWLGKIREV
jgi:hypothetical protein